MWILVGFGRQNQMWFRENVKLHQFKICTFSFYDITRDWCKRRCTIWQPSHVECYSSSTLCSLVIINSVFVLQLNQVHRYHDCKSEWKLRIGSNCWKLYWFSLGRQLINEKHECQPSGMYEAMKRGHGDPHVTTFRVLPCLSVFASVHILNLDLTFDENCVNK